MPLARYPKLWRMVAVICFINLSAGWACSQEPPAPSSPESVADSKPALKHRPPEVPETPKPGVVETVELTVAKGTALQVALDKEIRVKEVGQAIHGRIVSPVYAFDKLVVPVGTEVVGKISGVSSVSLSSRIPRAGRPFIAGSKDCR